MKKQVISMLLTAAVIVCLLAGCGTDSGKTDDTKGQKEEQTEEPSDVKADPVDQKKVFVTPEWVKSVIDGNQKESENYVILECAWGETADDPAYEEGHIKGSFHMNTDSVESEEF